MLLFVGAAGALEVELLLLHLDLGVLAVLQADRDEDQVCPLRPLAERGNHARPESQLETSRLLDYALLRVLALELGTSLGLVDSNDDGAHGLLFAVLFALLLHCAKSEWRLRGFKRHGTKISLMIESRVIWKRQIDYHLLVEGDFMCD